MRASDIDVPQEHASVDAHRDELLVVRAELHRADGARVANALADHLGGLEVPHAHLVRVRVRVRARARARVRDMVMVRVRVTVRHLVVLAGRREERTVRRAAHAHLLGAHVDPLQRRGLAQLPEGDALLLTHGEHLLGGKCVSGCVP